jgi:chromosome segregation ATPase
VRPTTGSLFCNPCGRSYDRARAKDDGTIAAGIQWAARLARDVFVTLEHRTEAMEEARRERDALRAEVVDLHHASAEDRAVRHELLADLRRQVEVASAECAIASEQRDEVAAELDGARKVWIKSLDVTIAERDAARARLAEMEASMQDRNQKLGDATEEVCRLSQELAASQGRERWWKQRLQVGTPEEIEGVHAKLEQAKSRLAEASEDTTRKRGKR